MTDVDYITSAAPMVYLNAGQIERERIAREEQKKRGRAQAEAAEAERVEKQLLRELAEEDRKALEAAERLASLPPETTIERANRELRQRVERLEAERDGREVASAPPQLHFDHEQKQNRRREALRLLRNRRDAAEGQVRLEAHRRAVHGEVKRVEGAIEGCDRELSAEDQRHAAARDGINSRRRELDDTLAALLRPLAADETSEGRLADVLGVTV
jgi:hypothetical protein